MDGLPVREFASFALPTNSLDSKLLARVLGRVAFRNATAQYDLELALMHWLAELFE